MRLFHRSAKGMSSAESQVSSPFVLGVLHGTIPLVESQAEPSGGTGVCQVLPGQAGQLGCPCRALGRAFRDGDFTHSAWNSCGGGAKEGRGFPQPQHRRGEQLPWTPQQPLLHPSSIACIPEKVTLVPEMVAGITELLDLVQRVMLIVPGSDP